MYKTGNMSDHIYVTKRNGNREPVSFDQILRRLQSLADGLEHVNPDLVAQKVCSQIQDGIKTSDLDEFAAETCAMMQARYHPNYGKLAARIIIDNHQKQTSGCLRDVVEKLYHGNVQVIADSYHEIVCKHYDTYNAMMDFSRDFVFDYFGFKTLMTGYLLKQGNAVIERPQHLWMRVAIQLHGDNFERVRETYDALSQGYFIHATPTLYNSGSSHPQLSSCFLVHMADDSIKGIYDTLGECAQISKWAGGIGLSVHNIRAKGSTIHGTNGKSTGLVPMLRVFNDTAKYVNQGGKRNGAFAIYLEPWHADIEDFLRLKMNTGYEDDRARDLFYGLWVPDLFMKRVEEQGEWTLFSPDEAPGLSDSWGAEFEKLYVQYEAEGRGMKKVPAQKIWQMVLDAQVQTGTPYILYKDAANAKSNQQNLGTIKSSNLCVAPETIVLTDKGQFPIKELVNTEVCVWNGNGWSNTTVVKTGENQPILTVVVEDSISNENHLLRTETRYIRCTHYHKFLMENTGSIKDAQRKDAQDLDIGDELYEWTDECGNTHTPRVIRVLDDDDTSDTYCFNEPVNHAGVFNGILTGNCTEIIEYTSPEETAVCNLGSIALPRFIENGVYNFDKLRQYTKILTRNLDVVIDKNFYPTEKCRRSNLRHRPIGIGVQGLADVFAILRLPWSSDKASKLNREIFENIYHAAVEASAEIAGCDMKHSSGFQTNAYASYEGSPASKGNLQYDLWKQTPTETPYLDWAALKAKVAQTGLRNSLLVAPMPTASTSQILGNNECIEPFTNNIYTRRVLAGEFVVVNKYLVEDLIARGLWTSAIRTDIIANGGSVQNIVSIPSDIRELYRTAWEIPMKTIINMAADRAPFICQSQSLNLFMSEPAYSKISSMHFYAWRKGLKTGCYYLRTRAAAKTQQFTIEPPQACVSCSA
jgi:ribonucleotide reductase alpha subunit